MSSSRVRTFALRNRQDDMGSTNITDKQEADWKAHGGLLVGILTEETRRAIDEVIASRHGAGMKIAFDKTPAPRGSGRRGSGRREKGSAKRGSGDDSDSE